MEISEKRLKELERAEAKLNALENYGVDNWEGYGDALTEYHQENAIDESYDEHGDEDIYYGELNDLLEYFSKHTLEGEPYYVVLPEDLVTEENNK